MTQNVRSYYAELRRQEGQLTDEWYYMMSLDERQHGYHGGVITQVSRANAARLLTKRSHRIATPEEIEAWKQAETEKRKDYAATDYQRFLNANPLLQQVEAARQITAQNQPGKTGKEK